METASKNVHERIDWVTAVAKQPEVKRRLFEVMRVYLDHEKETTGEVAESWSFRGYFGWKLPHVRWGTRADSDIMIGSGELAPEVYHIIFDSGACDNVSRIDLAVTCALQTPANLAIEYYDEVKRLSGKAGVCKRQYALIQNTAQGQTLYVGSRQSTQFGRVYDKGMQQKALQFKAGELWRFEVEFKDERAYKVARQLKEVQVGVIANCVHKWFSGRHIAPIWPFGSSVEEIIDTTQEATLASDEATLRWLSTQVKPSIIRLSAKGKLEQVFYSLDLPKYIDWDKLEEIPG